MTRAVVALLFVLLVQACNGPDSPKATEPPSPTASRTAKPTATPTPSPAPTSELPARNLVDLARRFREATADPPLIARDTPYGYAIGDSFEFEVLDLSTPATRTVRATVRLVTEHAYFFVEEGASYTDSALQKIGADFENVVYPTVRRDFGPEPAPGVDSDPRITILHANLRGAGGYYNMSDQFPRAIAPRSNEREMLYLEADILVSPGAAYNALVAHELQHLVHWNADPTEDSWVNEGMSQVAAEQVGGGSDWKETFLRNPDTQLTFWPAIEDASVHYAAAELFCSYLLDQYGGRERAKGLLAMQGDGIDGVDEYLGEFGETFRDVFADWAVANWLDAETGRYAHPGVAARTRVSTPVAAGDGTATVGQFGTDYLKVSGPGVLAFDGADEAGLGFDAWDGGFWWSNRGDGIDTKLTREVNLRAVQAAKLRFRAWYDIENAWDYAYVAASEDGGATWRALPGQKTTGYDPVEAAYGPGYTGKSGGWIQEEVDLSGYAGKQVLLRFEYVTDDASSLTGFAVDDIEIPELDFLDHADNASGWKAEGFTKVNGPLRQEFIVQVILEGPEAKVLPVILQPGNRAEIALDGPAAIAIAGATRGTAVPADYAWTFR